MSYELIISEKPAAAAKIAAALGDFTKKAINKVPYYEVNRNGKEIIIASAVGHLYSLNQKSGLKYSYPVYDIEWVPANKVNKSHFSSKYLTALKKLAKDAKEITVATDYDIEGEVIGLNIVRFACKKKDANRMKFSTLTKEDLIEAYKNKSKTLDWGQANAGETRHMLDWFYGINLSRALTESIKNSGRFKIMSIGRVQGPALKVLVTREKEILAFKPIPYWQLQLNCKKEEVIESWHIKDKIFEKETAQKIFNKIKNETKVKVESQTTKEFKQKCPTPFDLTTLQMEAHRTLKISPKRTLELAQELYTSGYISYPRTSSQKLPEKLGYLKIIKALEKQSLFSDMCKILLSKKKLKPNEGKKSDPAHPSIYPTGNIPKFDDDKTGKLYELIAKRFLSVFGDDATRETVTLTLNCKDELFTAKGTRTTKPGWHELYKPFVTLQEIELPVFKEGEILEVVKIINHNKETLPPKRYTEASIIKDLEKNNLGTKATRANIVETLFNRGYIEGKPIHATELGIKIIDTLEKYSPTIIDTKLTRTFEEEMEKIREGKENEESVLNQAKKVITKIINDFKKNKDIGKDLYAAQRETEDNASYVGKCPTCKEGDLHIRKGKFGIFIACNKYPNCKTTFSLPKAIIKPNDKLCEHCNYPTVLVIKRGKRPTEVCINPKCPSKQLTEEQEKSITEENCPKCGKPLKIRTSIYGSFIGCTSYPKCKFTKKIVKDDEKDKL